MSRSLLPHPLKQTEHLDPILYGGVWSLSAGAAKDWRRWLAPSDPARPPVDLVRPFDADLMKAWCVDRRINNVKNNDAELGEPVKDDEPPQLGMFNVDS